MSNIDGKLFCLFSLVFLVVSATVTKISVTQVNILHNMEYVNIFVNIFIGTYNSIDDGLNGLLLHKPFMLDINSEVYPSNWLSMGFNSFVLWEGDLYPKWI